MARNPHSTVTLTRDASAIHCSADELRKIQIQLDENGYSYVTGVSIGEFDYVAFAASLGKPIPHHNGELIWNICIDPAIDSIYHSGNMGALLPHTEANEHPGLPPRYLMLWCVREASGAGGETTLADGYEWIENLSKETRETLIANHYTWHSFDGIAQSGYYSSAAHPILEEFNSTQILRYDYFDVERKGDGFLDPVLESVKSFFAERKIAIGIESGCILVWDNWRMLHGRNAFSDPERHLKRVLISDRSTR